MISPPFSEYENEDLKAGFTQPNHLTLSNLSKIRITIGVHVWCFRCGAILSEEKAKTIVVKMAIPASVEQEIRDKRIGKDANPEVSNAAASDVGKRESGDVKLETDPSETGEPFVTKFGPAITTADVLIVPQGCQLLQSCREVHTSDTTCNGWGYVVI